MDRHSEHLGEHKNYLSEDSDSDKEAPAPYVEIQLEPIV